MSANLLLVVLDAESLSDFGDRLPLPKLPPKAQRIAELAIAGLSNRQIAADCNTTEQVIKNYLRQIYDRCGVWSRTELAARFRCA